MIDRKGLVKMRKIVSVLRDVVFLLIIVICCWCIIQITDNKAPSMFGMRIFRVISVSMRPTIGKGDCILVKSTDTSSLVKGDIITFRSRNPRIKGYYNTHRIFDIQKDEQTGENIYITKGDNNAYPDTYSVTQDEIVGKYVRTIIGGRTISSFITFIMKKWNYFLFIIVPILLCVITCIYELIKEIVTTIKSAKTLGEGGNVEEINKS